METIAAISTAIGNGGIGIIRMSGKESFEILQKIFRNNKNEKIDLNKIKGYLSGIDEEALLNLDEDAKRNF